MKPLLIRVFALAILASSMLAFGASSPCKDEKTAAPCSTPEATAPQSKEDQNCDTKMKKEKKTKKNMKEQKQDDNYPGFGIYG